jgi:hypothetical protein
MSYRAVLNGVYGLVVGPANDESELFYEFDFPAAGQNANLYTVTDPGRRVDTLTVSFTVLE